MAEKMKQKNKSAVKDDRNTIRQSPSTRERERINTLIDSNDGLFAGSIRFTVPNTRDGVHEVRFYHKTYRDWVYFLDQCAYNVYKSAELNAYMAAAIGKPELAFVQPEKYGYQWIADVRYGVIPLGSMKEGAKTLLRAMLFSKNMDLIGDTGAFSSPYAFNTAQWAFPVLMSQFCTAYITEVLSEIKTEELSGIDVDNFSQETASAKGYMGIIEGASNAALLVMKEIMSIDPEEETRALVDAKMDRVFELGKLTGRAIQVLAKNEEKTVDDIGDAVTLILTFIPGSSLARKFFDALAGLGTDYWTDTYKTKGDVLAANSNTVKMNAVVEELLKTLDRYSKIESDREARRERLLRAIERFMRGVGSAR